jgi:hypothetical protein
MRRLRAPRLAMYIHIQYDSRLRYFDYYLHDVYYAYDERMQSFLGWAVLRVSLYHPSPRKTI